MLDCRSPDRRSTKHWAQSHLANREVMAQTVANALHVRMPCLQVTEKKVSGRLVGTRTPDLYRVNLPPIGKITTYKLSNILSTIVISVSQVRITGRNGRYFRHAPGEPAADRDPETFPKLLSFGTRFRLGGPGLKPVIRTNSCSNDAAASGALLRISVLQPWRVEPPRRSPAVSHGRQNFVLFSRWRSGRTTPASSVTRSPSELLPA
jgi:hypothetical protein